jgi:hypothetical protein
VEVTPREVSSTNAEPMVDTVCCEETDVKVAVASRGSMESTIRQKTNNHRRGPAVEPCPGPNNGVVGVLKYVVSEVPYIIFYTVYGLVPCGAEAFGCGILETKF